MWLLKIHLHAMAEQVRQSGITLKHFLVCAFVLLVTWLRTLDMLYKGNSSELTPEPLDFETRP